MSDYKISNEVRSKAYKVNSIVSDKLGHIGMIKCANLGNNIPGGDVTYSISWILGHGYKTSWWNHDEIKLLVKPHLSEELEFSFITVNADEDSPNDLSIKELRDNIGNLLEHVNYIRHILNNKMKEEKIGCFSIEKGQFSNYQVEKIDEYNLTREMRLLNPKINKEEYNILKNLIIKRKKYIGINFITKLNKL